MSIHFSKTATAATVGLVALVSTRRRRSFDESILSLCKGNNDEREREEEEKDPTSISFYKRRLRLVEEDDEDMCKLLNRGFWLSPENAKERREQCEAISSCFFRRSTNPLTGECIQNPLTAPRALLKNFIMRRRDDEQDSLLGDQNENTSGLKKTRELEAHDESESESDSLHDVENKNKILVEAHDVESERARPPSWFRHFMLRRRSLEEPSPNQLDDRAWEIGSEPAVEEDEDWSLPGERSLSHRDFDDPDGDDKSEEDQAQGFLRRKARILRYETWKIARTAVQELDIGYHSEEALEAAWEAAKYAYGRAEEMFNYWFRSTTTHEMDSKAKEVVEDFVKIVKDWLSDPASVGPYMDELMEKNDTREYLEETAVKALAIPAVHENSAWLMSWVVNDYLLGEGAASDWMKDSTSDLISWVICQNYTFDYTLPLVTWCLTDKSDACGLTAASLRGTLYGLEVNQPLLDETLKWAAEEALKAPGASDAAKQFLIELMRTEGAQAELRQRALEDANIDVKALEERKRRRAAAKE